MIDNVEKINNKRGGQNQLKRGFGNNWKIMDGEEEQKES